MAEGNKAEPFVHPVLMDLQEAAGELHEALDRLETWLIDSFEVADTAVWHPSIPDEGEHQLTAAPLPFQ